MKKTILLLLGLFALTIGTTYATSYSSYLTTCKVQTFADSGTFIYYVQRTANDTTTAHANFYQIDKEGLQINKQANVVYLTRSNGGYVYGATYKLTLTPKTDSITTGSHTAFAVVNGDYGSTALFSYLNSIKQVSYKSYRSSVTTVAAVKSSRGVLYSISIDSVGVGGEGTATIWDAATTADTGSTNTPLFSGSITSLRQIVKNTVFRKGLVIKQKTSTAGRVSLIYNFVEPPNEFDKY